jgi:hypothetical protein
MPGCLALSHKLPAGDIGKKKANYKTKRRASATHIAIVELQIESTLTSIVHLGHALIQSGPSGWTITGARRFSFVVVVFFFRPKIVTARRKKSSAHRATLGSDRLRQVFSNSRRPFTFENIDISEGNRC